LTSSEKNGVAYVNTMNLDGETNLKLKRTHPRTYEALEFIQFITTSQHLKDSREKKEEEVKETDENTEKMLSIEHNIAYLLHMWEGEVTAQPPSRSLTNVRILI
jgi:magnesium-transporting ATPase (P-type)